MVCFPDWTLAVIILGNGSDHRKNTLKNVQAWFVFFLSLGHNAELFANGKWVTTNP